MTAPLNFSLIDNTEEVLAYMTNCRTLLHEEKKVFVDIENVTNITPDAIAYLVACTNDSRYRGRGQVQGNTPSNPLLSKLFAESGFYNFVNTSLELKKARNLNTNLLHKERDFKVRPDVAKEACLYGTNHIFHNSNPLPELYEMIIEAMSNTNNHASKNTDNKIKWWLYAHNSSSGISSYTFVDLGVGIFDSIPVRLYKKVGLKVGLVRNVDLVSDLLEGKIKSREVTDNTMRGKGIPQIADNSLKDTFKRAYIISNDVKIDLKNRDATRLSNDFKGTLLYWELTNNNTNNNDKNNNTL